ncbi:hypothetical protein Sliba_54490 [Streptomyces nigrescens]|uniref:Uncharacterized protein n=1 Tax=Streptomyces nigrescens TaxID=1920 RepID=A0A640TRZ9_STRNI|nr:hypothetical protein Sliba_54490 [Streptomyces libani subsp. libani]GGV95816.1 hypothetical protein GCM10010500_37420 [Streptomyces libani subsp. libani]
MSVVVAVIGKLLGATGIRTVRIAPVRKNRAVPPAGQGVRAEPLCFFTIQNGAAGDNQAGQRPAHQGYGSCVRDSRDARVTAP